MTAKRVSVAEDEPQPRSDISVSNLKRDIAQLVEELRTLRESQAKFASRLAETARKHRAPANRNGVGKPSDASMPPA